MVAVDDGHARRLKLADDVDVRLVTGWHVNPVSSEVHSSYRVGSIRLNDRRIEASRLTHVPHAASDFSQGRLVLPFEELTAALTIVGAFHDSRNQHL